MQSGGFIYPEYYNIFPPFRTKNSLANSLNSNLVDGGLNVICKKNKKGISSITGSGITLRNNEIKDTMKVIKSLENRGTLLKGTTRKITSQEGGFLNFLKPLMQLVYH